MPAAIWGGAAPSMPWLYIHCFGRHTGHVHIQGGSCIDCASAVPMQEVTTLTLGESPAFPALMCRESGANAPGCLPTADAFAAMLHAKVQLRIKGYGCCDRGCSRCRKPISGDNTSSCALMNFGHRGTLLAVPAPEHLAIANDVYHSAVAQAEIEASYEDVCMLASFTALCTGVSRWTRWHKSCILPA